MAKKDNSPAISFFSFQDIITSITGIMFLVVMMLVLMILQQPDSAAKQMDQRVKENVKKLEQEVKALKQSLLILAKQAEMRKKRLEELKKLNMEKLPAIKNELVSKLEAADALLLQMDAEEKDFLKKQKEEVDKKAKLLLDLDENEKLKKVNELKIVELKDLVLRQKKLAAKYKNIVKFVWDKSNPKRPVLLDCSEKKIVMNSLDGKIRNKSFSSISDCLDYCKTLPADDTYFILLIKPSAFHYAENLSAQLREAGFERGREIIAKEEQVLIGGEEAGK